MTVRVLTDYAHNDLWHSMVMLFEDRFGWELYRPIGMEWYDQDIWRFERERVGDVVARQFLAPWAEDLEGDGPYSTRPDPAHPGRTMRMVSLEQARAMGFDLVISTLAENEEGLHRFAREVGAHFGIQVGNQGAPNAWGLAEFALLSVTTPGFKPWMPHVTYHQEFSLEDYRFGDVSEPDLVATRVQCFSGTPQYETFRKVSMLVPEARFRHYGHCSDEDDLWGGNAPDVPTIGDQMRAARVAWHDKRWSDGYGHVLHSWFAVGRPVIGSSNYYTGSFDGIPKLGGPLFLEGVTSWDIDRRSSQEIAELVRRFLEDDDFWQTACLNATKRFHEVVDFDAEAEEIRRMLEGVLG